MAFFSFLGAKKIKVSLMLHFILHWLNVFPGFRPAPKENAKLCKHWVGSSSAYSLFQSMRWNRNDLISGGPMFFLGGSLVGECRSDTSKLGSKSSYSNLPFVSICHTRNFAPRPSPPGNQRHTTQGDRVVIVTRHA